jgi:deoxycytidine triphosphate deaminase
MSLGYNHSMVLSKKVILEEIEKGKLVVEPRYDIKEASIKAHLSGEFCALFGEFSFQDKYILKSKGFVLAKVREVITLPTDIAAFYDGYVEIAKKGLFTHGSSSFMDPGEKSQITLEMFNASDNEIVLEKDMRIGQFIFVKLL